MMTNQKRAIEVARVRVHNDVYDACGFYGILINEGCITGTNLRLALEVAGFAAELLENQWINSEGSRDGN